MGRQIIDSDFENRPRPRFIAQQIIDEIKSGTFKHYATPNDRREAVIARIAEMTYAIDRPWVLVYVSTWWRSEKLKQEKLQRYNQWGARHG